MDKKHYHCPVCSARLIWNLHNSAPGSTTTAICANDRSVSRMDFTVETIAFCEWRGIVERQEDGSVWILLDDSRTQLTKT